MAKKKSLFDDRPVEISELTYIIKHDLAAINRQLADLQAQSKGAQQQQQKKGRLEEHRSNVVTLLQSNLASATTAFQDVLEVRTQNMKMARDRTEQFAYGGQGGGPSGGMQQQGDNSGESALERSSDLKRGAQSSRSHILSPSLSPTSVLANPPSTRFAPLQSNETTRSGSCSGGSLSAGISGSR